MIRPAWIGIVITGCSSFGFIAPLAAQPTSRNSAAAAAIHPVENAAAMQAWLARVPRTRDFPADLPETLRSSDRAVVLEMTTTPGCLPCADLWSQLNALHRQYALRIAVLPADEGLVRSGRLGLPWIGHPVAWVRDAANPQRVIPIAIGTDYAPNLARNAYLAIKMLSGARPAVAVRAMSKFTGIVAPDRIGASRALPRNP